MQISRSSWHYKLASTFYSLQWEGSINACKYIRALIWSSIVTLFLTIAIAVFAVGLGDIVMTKLFGVVFTSMGAKIGLSLLTGITFIALVLLTVGGLVYYGLKGYNFLEENYNIAPAITNSKLATKVSNSTLVQLYKVKKAKYCPVIKFTK